MFAPIRLLDIQEATAILRIGRTTLYRRIAAGDLPTVKIGSRRLFRRADLEAFIQSHVQESGGAK